MDGRENGGQAGSRDVDQTCVGPDRVVGRLRLEFLQAHHPRLDSEPLVGLFYHGRRAIRGVESETAFADSRRIAPSATAKLEDACATRQTIEEWVEVAAGLPVESLGVERRLLPVSSKGRRVGHQAAAVSPSASAASRSRSARLF